MRRRSRAGTQECGSNRAQQDLEHRTSDAHVVVRDLRARWTVHQAVNDELLGPRLDDFNDLVREAGFSVIIAPPRPRRPIS